MPQALGRSNLNINLCFTRIKFPPLFSQSSSPSPQIPDHDDGDGDGDGDDDDDHSRSLSASLNNTSLTLVRHFNSLYEETQPGTSSSAAEDFAAAFASRRFFCSTPGHSNSIVDSAGDRDDGVALVVNSVAVPTLSPDPYADFRRSMQEMLEARNNHGDVKRRSSRDSSNWEFLHELLLCYLALNPKSTHKFIIGAFSDLLVSLLPSPPLERSEDLCGISDK